MSAFETLKEELELQKQAIEYKGGTVTVANDYPSPSEITAGIYTAAGKDLSDATATETDVLLGKTFYAGDETIKVGALEVVDQTSLIKEFFISGDTYETESYTINIMPGIKKIRSYAFRDNTRTAYIYFNDELTTIDEFAFYDAVNFHFPNFNSLPNIKTVNNYAFYNATNSEIDFTNLPRLTTVGSNAFNNCFTGGDFILPGSITSIDVYAFAKQKRLFAGNLTIEDDFSLTYLPANLFAYITFDCDLTIPASVTKLNSYAFYNTSFKNITIPATCTQIMNSVFNAISSESAANFNLRSIIFESETVPKFSSALIATQHLENGLKIYVPDTVIEDYKAASYLSNYADYIYPMSQKE